ncbi:pyruvoyl-dependent arginine decarboxylase (PvlArgDC) [Mycolicibacterium sp. BK556]|uniref:AfsA-related hotdog domain-containing protein n=1 Tax=unclassified Mycolicibacterium TaxID=2636767 RepID=UPI00161B73B9|nr:MULTISPECIES: AfsA-related hotdog domain-containing protein [unclassified Mycolicibacterium]MBB3605108.1 pyruvoyl-dependent arginine decarboxylase (PvlArgDC) [Mycolicibacterium sp. BK556]MBB3635304.1 pyruvoyl-dependent arginine decarboxylase (PvlArgDC) [Mycolicibacterium sp. BK607]
MNGESFSQTVRRELVHKRAVSEVLVTSVADQDGTWIVHAQLPRQHSFHTDGVGRQCSYYDPLLVLEAFRQGCIASSHLFYDAPPDARHTVRLYELSVVDFDHLQCGPEMLDLELTIVVQKEFRRGEDQGAVHGLEVRAVAAHEGTKTIELAAAFNWMPLEKWDRMRAGASWDPGPQPAPAEAASVGRTRTENVVIGAPVHTVEERSATAPLVVDIGHATLFDHPLDHLPGGLIIEAARQLSLAIADTRAESLVGPSWLKIEFQSFVEMDAVSSVAMTQDAAEPLTFRGDITQSGNTRATIELAFME